MSLPEKESVIPVPVKESWIDNLAAKVNPIDWIKEHVANLSATSLHIISVILLHSSTVPTLLSLMFGISDKTPILDMVLLLWAALLAMFAQALIQKNYVIVTVITVGFMIQSVIMALIFFR
jgi:hypothetical protein